MEKLEDLHVAGEKSQKGYCNRSKTSRIKMVRMKKTKQDMTKDSKKSIRRILLWENIRIML